MFKSIDVINILSETPRPTESGFDEFIGRLNGRIIDHLMSRLGEACGRWRLSRRTSEL
jgi:hypothetical protein